MSEYKTGRVYKIIHNQSNIVYVGSTFNILKQRWQKHKSHFNDYLKDKHSEIAIYPYFKKYGIDNFKIVLIKEYEVCDRKHLELYEQLWINKLKSINQQNTFGIRKLTVKLYQKKNSDHIKEYHNQYYQKNKEELAVKQKQYREENKEEIKEKQRKHYQDNKEMYAEKAKLYRESHKEEKKLADKAYRDSHKEKIKQYAKIYREQKRDELKQKKKEYYEANKAKINAKHREKITCECGDIVAKGALSSHKKSEKHLINLQKKEQEESMD